MNTFFDEVVKHTAEARQRWHFMEKEKPPRSLWNQILTEEIGKLNRMCNKLTLATDGDVRRGYTKEAKYRLITIASIAQRFYEIFEALPDSTRAYSCRDTQ